jgi:hypothetical protein
VATFTIHESSEQRADRLDRAEDLKFVRDGFSWLTAIFPPLGFMSRDLWWAVLAYLVFMAALIACLMALHVNDDLVSLIVVALHVYLGFEASTIERWFLNKGWSMVGAVTGRNLAECERRFFESWLPKQPIIGSSKGSGTGHAGGWPHGARA